MLKAIILPYRRAFLALEFAFKLIFSYLSFSKGYVLGNSYNLPYNKTSWIKKKKRESRGREFNRHMTPNLSRDTGHWSGASGILQQALQAFLSLVVNIWEISLHFWHHKSYAQL